MKSTVAANPLRRHGLRVTPGIAAVVLVLLADCSGSPSSSGSGGSSNAAASTASPSAVAFSACMRSHGVPTFPDPDSSGELPKVDPQLLGVGSSQFNAAQSTCQHLLPTNGGSLEQCERAGVCSPAEIQQWLDVGRRFAQCMRSHGVPNWPDPTIDPQTGGRVGFTISVSKDGFDPHSPQIESKGDECHRMMPGGLVPLAVSR